MPGMGDPRLTQLSEHLYRFDDICNAYIIVDGDAALLIDCGSGAVVEALAETGASAVEWVLHTHHHRDQCAGTPALAAAGAKVAAPEHERHLFEEAELFWRTRRVYDNYDDRNTFFTAARDIPVDAALRNNLERGADYTAELEPPPGWRAGDAASVRLRAGERGEVRLQATAPDAGDGVRRLATARIAVDGTPHGPIAEALVTVAGR